MLDELKRPKAVYKGGPYQEGGKTYWKVVVEYCRAPTAKRAQTSKRVATEEAADALVEEVMAAIAQGLYGAEADPAGALQDKTYGDLVAAFMDQKRKELKMTGQQTVNKLRNLRVTECVLHSFSPPSTPLSEFTPRTAAQVFKAACQRKRGEAGTELADATKVIYFSRLQALFTFAVEQGWQRTNPCAKLPMPKVKLKKGKKQLRLDQSRLFKKVALEDIRRPSAGARAKGIPVCVTSLVLALAASSGCRIGELLDCQVQDLDNGGTLLWIDRGKTQNARRYLDVVDYLQPFLRLLVQGRSAESPLFLSHARNKYGEAAPSKTSVGQKLRKLLARANLPQVCIHSLRGTFMSITAPRMGLSREFAAAVGHGDSGQTAEASYISPEARLQLRQQRLGAAQEVAARLLGDGEEAPRPEEEAARVVATLSPEQLLVALTPEQRAALETMIGRKGTSSKAVSGLLPNAGGLEISDEKMRSS
jgi:integrase